ncbi:MAG: LysR family transcriptional regulator [Candidatus Methanomethylophilus sp.]|nr:LysR family transcriptional regulator [Methanomethylophilus sp.]
MPCLGLFIPVDIQVRTEQIINGQTVTHRQLEALAAVGRTGSLTAAAHEMGITVPVVHRYIANVEAAAGEPVTKSTPAGTKLTPTGQKIADCYWATEARCQDRHPFTVCCSPVTEDLLMSVLSALKMTDVELIISDDPHNLGLMKQDMVDLAIIDDPLYLFDIEDFNFDAAEIGYMGMVYVDNGPSFIRYRYGAQRVAFMFLDTMKKPYQVDSETYSLPELLGSSKSFFVDEFLLTRKGLRMKSAVDPKILRHAITAVYRRENRQVARIVKALQARHIS